MQLIARSGAVERVRSGHVHHEKLCDLSRLSLIFDSYDDMQAMLNEMLSSAMFGGNVVRVENRYFNPTVLRWLDVQRLNARLVRMVGGSGPLREDTLREERWL